MNERTPHPSSNQPVDFRVLIAGGGIGGLEAVLALRELSPELEIELLSPAAEFSLAPLSVAEPFGTGPPPQLPLAEFCAEQGIEWTREQLAEVWPEQQRVLTDSGTELPYDALLLTPGARRHDVVADALSFWGRDQRGALERLVASAGTRGGRIAFVVPPGPSWPLPLYELALLVADRLRSRRLEIELRTPESSPLEILGSSASRRVREILEEAGISLHLEADERQLGAVPDADWVISLPVLDVPEIPGIAQASHGFINTDTRMRVEGAERVWAAGDVTWFPAKQGGIATQQADVAAADIAAAAGLDVEVPPFAPVLRVALLTPEGPYYLRSGSPDAEGEQRAPLWWPPAKVAGRLLAPYLAHRIDPDLAQRELLDMEADAARGEDHQEALDLALIGADLDAEAGELDRALRWLDVAEGLNIVVPEEYREKQRRWRRELAAGD